MLPSPIFNLAIRSVLPLALRNFSSVTPVS